MSGRTLSKGTLGLKFMNKVKPVDPSATPSSPAPAPAPAPSPSTSVSAATTSPAVNVKGKAVVKEVGFELKPEPTASTPAVPPSPTKRRVVHEGSLLSFPLLASSSSSSAGSSRTRTTFSSTSYSSMPLTAVAISGRRSFGGANQEIEQLNNPSAPAPIEEVPGSSSSSSHNQKKKRKSDSLYSTNLNVRRSDSPLNPSGGGGRGSFDANSDEISLGGGGRGGNKKPRREVEETSRPSSSVIVGGGGKKGFVRPGGFEGAKRGGGDAKTTRGKKPFDEHTWDEAGVARQWDVGKEFDDDGSGSDSSSEVVEVVKEDGEEFEARLNGLFKSSRREAEEMAIHGDELGWDEGEEKRSGRGPSQAKPKAKAKAKAKGKKGGKK